MSDDDIINKSGNIPLSIIDKPNKTPISRMFVSISIGGKDGLDVIKHILKNEQNININDKEDYWTYLLHYSIVMREEEIALFLIDKGADINLIDIYECTPLNYAVSRFEFKQFRGRNREIFLILSIYFNNAFIKLVFPQPGSPYSNIPKVYGIPLELYHFSSFRNLSTLRINSFF